MTATRKKLIHLGINTEQARHIAGGDQTVSAAGNDSQSNATQLDFGINEVSTVTPGSADSVVLPAIGQAGNDRVVIYNNSGQTLNVFPPVGAKINDSSVNVKVTVGDQLIAYAHRRETGDYLLSQDGAT